MIVAQQDLHLYKQLVAGLLIYTLNFFHSMHRQSKLRRVIRAQVLAKLKKENKGNAVDLKQFGLPGSMSFMRNHADIINDPEFIRADRTFLNIVEQAPMFFMSLFLFCAIIDPVLGGYIAIAYAVGRSLYFSTYHSPMLLLALVTVPNYLEILYMIGAVAYRVFSS